MIENEPQFCLGDRIKNCNSFSNEIATRTVMENEFQFCLNVLIPFLVRIIRIVIENEPQTTIWRAGPPPGPQSSVIYSTLLNHHGSTGFAENLRKMMF